MEATENVRGAVSSLELVVLMIYTSRQSYLFSLPRILHQCHPSKNV